MQLMCELGNSIVNHIYEGSCEEQGLKKPGPSSSRWVVRDMDTSGSFSVDLNVESLIAALIFKARKGGLDQSEVCWEEVPEEDDDGWSCGQRWEKIWAAMEPQEMQKT